MSGKTTDFTAVTQVGSSVPAQDATTNVYTRDVLGNKSDTEVTTGTASNSTLSVMAYLKALWDKLRSITFTNLDAAVSSRLASGIDPATDAGAAALVWGHTVRQITGHGNSLVLGHALNQTLATATDLDLRPGATIGRSIAASIGIPGGGSGGVYIFDGTNKHLLLNVAATTTGGTSISASDVSCGLMLRNTGAGSATYMYVTNDYLI